MIYQSTDWIDLIKRNVDMSSALQVMGLQVFKNKIKSVFNPADKTASCHIYFKTNTFKDYSSSEQGDVIDLWAAFYGLDKKVAIKDIVRVFRLVDPFSSPATGGYNDRYVPTRDVRPHVSTLKQDDLIGCLSEYEKDIYYERLGMANEAVAFQAARVARVRANSEIYNEMFRYSYLKGFSSECAEYLKSREILEGLNRFKVFQIGDYYALNNHLKKTFPLEQLQRCGIFNKKDDGSGNLIFFKYRLIIPYLHNGDIIYLRGRYFDETDNYKPVDCSKYLGPRNDALNVNTPKRLFNTDTLKNLLPGETVYITEGELDTIAIELLGFNANGIPGAGNMPAAEKFMVYVKKKLRPVICADDDIAGRKLVTGCWVDGSGVERYSENNLTFVFDKLGLPVIMKKLAGAKDANDFIVNRSVVND